MKTVRSERRWMDVHRIRCVILYFLQIKLKGIAAFCLILMHKMVILLENPCINFLSTRKVFVNGFIYIYTYIQIRSII